MEKTKDSAGQSFRAELPEQLLRSQAPAIQVILSGLFRILKARQQPDDDESKRKKREADVDRPHNVFLIDGRRGAGKTFTLLTVEKALDEFKSFVKDSSECAPAWKTKFESLQKLTATDVDVDLRSAFRASDRVPTSTIKVIFPGDLLVNESLMEFLFARLGENLKADLEDIAKAGHSRQTAADLSPETRLRQTKLRQLHDKLQNEVEQGWYFANRFGLEALVRDSSDYRDLVMRWGEESGKAAKRIETWRSFINEYLDFYHTETLVVLVDDSDVRQELTEDILHSIRMFLNHPRIVTVLAGNLKAMRDTLLYRSLERVASAIGALNKADHPASREWRRRERQTIDEYLEKVLPPAQRIHVSRPSASTVSKERTVKPGEKPKPTTDFEIIAGQSLLQYQLTAIRLTRKEFLRAKFKLAIEREFKRADAPTLRDRASIEMYLSWWSFANMYTDVLAPQSARQMRTFSDLYRGWFGPEWKDVPHERFIALRDEREVSPKRLPVMLFDSPANFTLIQRLNDEDGSLSEWLRRQPLASSWSGRRYFSVDDREVHEGTYTYHYVRYRLDVGVGMPFRDNAEEVVPLELLPRPLGRKYMRRFFQPRQMARRHRRLGVSRWMEHAAIPGNCIYFHDLQSLPDIAFQGGPGDIEALQSGLWESELADRWHELVEDRHESPADEYLIRYFGEIVCKSLQYTENLTSAALSEELDPPDIMEKQSRAIYEHFLADEIGMFAAHRWERREELLKALGPESSKAVRDASERLKRMTTEEDPIHRLTLDSARTPHSSQSKTGLQFPPASPLRMVALYSALITDLRRAWYAIRIYESLPKYMGGSMGTGDQQQRASLAVVANRDRMKLYRRESIEAVLKRTEWGSRILDVFSRDNVMDVIRASKKFSPSARQKLHLDQKSLEAIYGIDPGEIVRESQIPAETEDFENWTTTLRHVGRSICRRWPVHDHLYSGEAIDLENELFAKDEGDNSGAGGSARQGQAYVMLRIFDGKRDSASASLSPEEAEKKAADDNLRRENTRSARNLIWLLYGLAPSLSAVIHADIMSRIYEAELVERGLYDDNNRRQGDRPFSERKKFRARVRDHYTAAQKEIESWGELVGSLAVLVRYIKIKCLHLDTALFLQAVQESSPNANTLNPGEELFEHCGYKIQSNPHGIDVIKEFVTCLYGDPQADWSGFQCNRISEGLAAFPDVSPSTLFGDQWVHDILTRDGVSKALVSHFKKKGVTIKPPPAKTAEQKEHEGSLSVNGIFGETEQWLWAANRTLRKLKAVLDARYKLGNLSRDEEDREADDEDKPQQTPPSAPDENG